jgi:hypothetical protein
MGFKRQKPIRSIRDEVYDANMASIEKQKLKEAYESFFNTISQADAKELKKMLR